MQIYILLVKKNILCDINVYYIYINIKELKFMFPLLNPE